MLELQLKLIVILGMIINTSECDISNYWQWNTLLVTASVQCIYQCL